jgi:hypothetical protein
MWQRNAAARIRSPRRLSDAIRRLRAASLARATHAWAREVASSRWRCRAAEVGLARTLRRAVGVALWRWARRSFAEREEWSDSSFQLAAAAAEGIVAAITRLRDGFCQVCVCCYLQPRILCN